MAKSAMVVAKDGNFMVGFGVWYPKDKIERSEREARERGIMDANLKLADGFSA
jgi:hypothetical protein